MMLIHANRFPHRVRIHDEECGAVARALHHEAESFSLPAVLKNVLGTTNERTKMSKMTFKRISLAVVAALGFGVLSVAPSSAAIDETLTLSAASATVNIGDTATVTITNSFTSEVANGIGRAHV